jgi:hypothetical protein
MCSHWVVGGSVLLCAWASCLLGVAASGNVLYAKGAPESILARCTHLRTITGATVRVCVRGGGGAHKSRTRSAFPNLARSHWAASG